MEYIVLRFKIIAHENRFYKLVNLTMEFLQAIEAPEWKVIGIFFGLK